MSRHSQQIKKKKNKDSTPKPKKDMENISEADSIYEMYDKQLYDPKASELFATDKGMVAQSLMKADRHSP